MPGRTPAASAAAVTGPRRKESPGSGASAAARVARRGRSRSIARSSNPGMRMQAITGTYVLHEHTFPCNFVGNYTFKAGTLGTAWQADVSGDGSFQSRPTSIG